MLLPAYRYSTRYIGLFLLLTLCSGYGIFAHAQENSPALYPLQIATQQGTIRYKVEIARTHQEQARGLMHRETMPTDQGMIFLHNSPNIIRMWMKNTLIGLDMIFIDQFGTVRHIHKGAIPHDETIISSVHAVVAVLELNAGKVVEDKIQIGDRVTLGPEQ